MSTNSPAQKPKIALFTTVEGHTSIAEAAKQALADHYDVVTFFDRDELMNLYVFIYQNFPGTFKIPFEISQNQSIMRYTQGQLLRKYRARIHRFISQHRPELLISTYALFNPAIEAAAQASNLPFINIVTDPWTFHPLFISRAAEKNIVFDDRAVHRSEEFESGENTTAMGWFVRQEFSGSYQVVKVREELQLDPKMLTLVIATGSEGTNSILTILPALLKTAQPVQVVIACGNNRRLFKVVKATQRILRTLKSPNKFIPIPFTHEIHKYFQAADLVIGKAGPNTIFEVVATQTPFLAITHVAGQEDGNLQLIAEYGLGMVEENPFAVGKLLQQIIENPAQLTAFKKSITKMADYNATAPKNLRQEVARLLASKKTHQK